MAAPAIGAAAKALGRRALVNAALSRRSGGRRTAGCGCAAVAACALAMASIALLASFVTVTTPLDASQLPDEREGSRGVDVVPMTCPGFQVSQGYGDTPYEHPHTGVDLVCPAGTPVAAVADGVFHQRQGGSVPCVFPAGARGGLGTYGELDVGDVQFLYGHLEAFAVADGTAIPAGTVLGFEGTSGCSTGFHLHFEVHVAGRLTNPCPFLPQGYPAAHDPAGARCWGAAPP